MDFVCNIQPVLCVEPRPRRVERPAIIEPYVQRTAPAPRFAAPRDRPEYRPTQELARPSGIPRTIAAPEKVAVAFLTYQWMCAYEDGRIAVRNGTELCSPISSGQPGHRTPLTDPEGESWKIVWMHARHCSHEFPRPNDGCDDGGAPMPHSAFFYKGVAFHAGYVRVPDGKPYGQSHGCVRLPAKMARLLYEQFFTVGMPVIVTSDGPTFLVKWDLKPGI